MGEPRWTALSSSDAAVLCCCNRAARSRKAVQRNPQPGLAAGSPTTVNYWAEHPRDHPLSPSTSSGGCRSAPHKLPSTQAITCAPVALRVQPLLPVRCLVVRFGQAECIGPCWGSFGTPVPACTPANLALAFARRTSQPQKRRQRQWAHVPGYRARSWLQLTASSPERVA